MTVQLTDRDPSRPDAEGAGVDTAPAAPRAHAAGGIDDLDAARILDSARDAFIAMDADGNITAWNDAAAAMFGYRRDEAYGRSVAELIIPEAGRVPYRTAMDRFLETRTPRLVGEFTEQQALRRSGETFPAEITHWWVESSGRVTFYAFVRDISERRANEVELARRRAREAELTHRTLHDDLTGLANRTLVIEHLTHALARRLRYGGDLAVLFVDLDRFKVINDSLGHDAGDELLCVAAYRLSAAVRAADTVARVAGDEFVVVCDELAGPEEATAVAQRILTALQAPVDLGAERVRIRGSVGIAFATSEHDTAEDLLRDADAAMYRAKERGRGQIAVFDDSMRERLRNRLQIERELAECVDRQQLRMRYRPVVDLKTGDVAGLQPIVHWEHPRLGLLDPAAFIDIAEDTGAMRAVTTWAVAHWCAQLGRRQADTGTSMLSVASFTARQAAQPGFVGSLLVGLTGSGLDPATVRVLIEAPADAALAGPETIRRVFSELRELGVLVGINHFGVGAAALAWIATVPFDILRLAPEFADSIETDERRAAVVRAVVTMARDMGIGVFINGVSTAAARDRVAELGCDFGEGRFFGDPMPADEAFSLW